MSLMSSRGSLSAAFSRGVDPLEVGDQLGGDPPPGPAGEVARAYLRQQRLGLRRGQVLLRAARDKLEEQVVQLRDHPSVVLPKGAAPVGQHAQHRELLVIDHRSQAGHPGSDERDGVRVRGVGLTALPGREHPSPGGQLGRDVDDLLAVSDQSNGDVPSDAAAPLDSPDPVGPLLRLA